MQESLSSEHGCKLLRDTFEQLLNSCAVSNEGARHLQTSWRDVTDCCLHIVWNPLNKVAAVLVLDVQHLFIYFLHGHATTEHGSYS